MEASTTWKEGNLWAKRNREEKEEREELIENYRFPLQF